MDAWAILSADAG